MKHFYPRNRLFGLVFFLILPCAGYSWGFYGHKLINLQAVFALPAPLQQFFIQHMDYLSAHAVDPDKRRYAVKQEAPQHFFDTEVWSPYVDIKERHHRRDLLWAIPSLMLVDHLEDTTFIMTQDTLFGRLIEEVGLNFTGSEWETPYGIVIDTMIQHGIVPLTIHRWYKKLVRSFEDRNMEQILKYAAELGHYIGDAHVPLHTTKNYNGQLTNQVGIHAFWETHVPELMAETEFDLISGPVYVVDDPLGWAWQVINKSYEKVDSVLLIEKEVRSAWPDDKEDCSRRRVDQVTVLPCGPFLQAYHKALNGMVERRMRETIQAVASMWWSAYIEAGQPDLSKGAVTVTHETKEEGVILNQGQSRCK